MWYSQDERKVVHDHFTASGRTEVTEAEVKEFIKEIKAAAKRCRKAAGPVVRSDTCYKTEPHFGSAQEEAKFTAWAHGQSQGAWIVLGASGWSGWGKNGNYTERVPQHDKIAARDLGLQRWAEAQAAEPLGHLLDVFGFTYDNASISLTYDRAWRILVHWGDVVIIEDPDRLARLEARKKRARIRDLRQQIPSLEAYIRSKEADLLKYKAELEELTADMQITTG